MQTPKEQFLGAFEMEHATTSKVLNALPADQGEFRPHPRSQSARELAWTFVIEQVLITKAMTDTLDLGAGFPKVPDNFAAIKEQFEHDYRQLVEVIKKTPDARFNEGSVKFFTAPKTVGDIPVAQFVWFILCDQIHHRGQYSVYVRLAGGKVPSIYGPSADEPWM